MSISLSSNSTFYYDKISWYNRLVGIARRAEVSMVRFLCRVRDILWRRDVEFAEIQGALVSFLWGAWLLNPYYVSSNFAQSVLLWVAPSWAWGMLFLFVGAFQFFGLAYRKQRVRRFGSIGACMLWLFVGIFLAQDDWRTLSVPTVFAFSLGSAWGFIRLGRL